MSTLDKARIGIKVLCALVLSVGMMAVLPGVATAEGGGGIFNYITFCDPVYDNGTPTPPTDPQVFGAFTDLRRGTQINQDVAKCVLNLTGSVGSAGDMWITMFHPPGAPALTFQCGIVAAEVTIHRFDNRKAVGVVTNYDPASGKGLFLGLYDNGNSDALTLSTFEATATTAGKLTGTVANVFLGSKVKENAWYIVELNFCNDGGNFVSTGGFVLDGDTFEELGGFEISDGTPLPTGISPSGQIGIAGQAKNSFVDSSVTGFGWAWIN